MRHKLQQCLARPLLCLLANLWPFSASAVSQKRVALVIGYASYLNQRVLKNPVDDGCLLSKGFKESRGKPARLQNCTQQSLKAATLL